MLLPIVVRELRVMARKPRTYYARPVAAVLAMLIVANVVFTLQFARGFSATQVRLTLMFLALLGLVYAMTSGSRITADCISEEKRNQTLGFLFLTRLRGYDVVLGKLAAHAIPTLYWLMATIPVVAILLLVGGIAAGTLFSVAAAVLNALFFSLAIGVTTSAMFRSRRASETASGILMVILFVLLPIFALMVEGLWGLDWLRDLLFFISPIPGVGFWIQLLPFTGGLSSSGNWLHSFWLSLLFNHSLAWLILFGASWRLARSWRETVPARRWTWRDRWRQWRFGNARQRQERRQGCLNQNAFYWLAARDRCLAYRFWWLVVLSLVIPAGIFGFGGAWGDVLGSMIIASFFIWYFVPKVMVATEASRPLAEERREGTLELILSTPLTVAEILRGQRLALARHYGQTVVIGLAVQVSVILALLNRWVPPWLNQSRTEYLVLFMVCLFFYAFDLWTIHWVGMWQGLRTGNPKKASGATIQNVVLVPALVWLLSFSALRVIGVLFFNDRISFNPYALLGAWIVICIANNLFWQFWCRQHLLREFRNVASQPLSKPAALGAWGRWLGQWWKQR